MSTFSMKTRICRHLDKYVSDRVWADPYLECRINTRPSILNPASDKDEWNETSGNIPVNGVTRSSPYTPLNGVLYGEFEQIGLPEGGPFYVYSIDLEQIRPIKLNTTSWTSLAERCNGSILSFRVYSTDGVCIPRNDIYIRQSPYADSILLAVDATTFHMCCDIKGLVVTYNSKGIREENIKVVQIANPSDLIVTTYIDPDCISKDGVIETYEADNVMEYMTLTSDDIIRLKNYKTNPIPSNKDFVFRNGRLLTEDPAGYLSKLAVGDKIEMVTDPDIVSKIYSTRASAKTYHTSSDGDYMLVHVPLKDNPHKYLITYLMCDVFIVPNRLTQEKLDASYAPGALGFHVHMVNRQDDSTPLFKQLTFNDFGISLNKLDEYARACGVEETDGVLDYTIKVYVRHHLKKLGIARDSNYCDLLYDKSHTDEKIIELLTADYVRDEEHMWFWTAKHLHDTSAYAAAMVQPIGGKEDANTQCAKCDNRKGCEHLAGKPTDVKDVVCRDFTTRGIKDYVDILGYYNTLHLIAKRVTTYKVVPVRTTDMVVDFVDGVAQNVHTNVQGVVNKVVPVQVPVAFADQEASSFHPVVYLNGKKLEDDVVTNAGYGTGDTNGFAPVYYTYTPRFNEVNWSDGAKWLNIKIADSVEVKEGDYITVELIATVDDERIYRARKEFDVFQGVYFPIGSVGDKDVTGTPAAGSSVAVTVPKDVYHPVTSTGEKVVRQNHEQLYINGKHLVKGIDHVSFSDYSEDDFYPISQNVSYLKKKNNVIDVVTTPDRLIGLFKGFTIGDWIEWADISTVWFDDLSILVVDGEVQNRFSYKYTGFDLTGTSIRNGSPFMVRTCIAESIAKLLEDECGIIDGKPVKDLDDEKLGLIKDYFYKNLVRKPYRSVIPYEHRIYSTYLLAIIKDYLEGDFDFDILADKEAFVAQFAAYEHLKSTDVVYSENGLTADEFRFVDVYPIYYNATLNSTEQRRKINYMVQMLLPADAMRHRKHINV